MVHTSPADRAFETALTIFHRTDTGLATVEALNEIDFGAWTGRSFVDLGEDPDWRKWNNERASSRPPNGESMVEAQARIVAHLESTAREWTGGTVILVSHADMIRAAVCHVLEMQLGAFWRFDVDAASATTLEWNDWGGRLVSLNERSGERPLASFPSPRA